VQCLAPDLALLFSYFWVNPSSSHCPTLSDHTEPISQGHLLKVTSTAFKLVGLILKVHGKKQGEPDCTTQQTNIAVHHVRCEYHPILVASVDDQCDNQVVGGSRCEE